jgi:hypothetical protein
MVTGIPSIAGLLEKLTDAFVLFLCAQAEEVLNISPVAPNRSAPKIFRFPLILAISFLFSHPIQTDFSLPMPKKTGTEFLLPVSPFAP